MNSANEQEIQQLMDRHAWSKTQAKKFLRCRSRPQKEAEPKLRAIRESMHITAKELAIVINTRADD